jgi:excisionase family DNA binding protein
MIEPWISVDEIAAHLGVRKDSVYRWIDQRGLPAHKVGRLWKFKRSEVDHWVRSAPPAVASPGQGRTVLLVDDDVEIRDTLTEFFADEGYQALVAADGEQALALLQNTSPPPSVIILDLSMPTMSGEQFRQAQLGDPRLAGIPIIVVTGDRKRSIPGAVMLRKPLRLEALADEVARLVPA